MVKIRLKRFGAKKRPYYRVVVVDSRKRRDGRTIEEIGYYRPVEKSSEQVRINRERVENWRSKGALLSKTVDSLLRKK